MAPFHWVKACIESHGRPLYACAFNPYSRPEHPLHLAVAGINQVSIYEIGEDNDIHPKSTFNDPSLSTFEDYSGEGNRASGARTNRIYALNWLYDDRTQQVMVAFGGENGVIRVVDVSSGKEVLIHSGHGNAVNEIRVHPTQYTVYASASKDMTVRIWSSRTPVALAVVAGFEGHRDQILSCDWSPCGSYLASGSMDHTVRLWKITNEIQNRIDTTSSREYLYKGENLQLHNLEETCYASDQSACTGDLHTNYVDCVRFFDQFLLTKSSENVLMISKFGDFSDGVAGGYGGKSDTMRETSISQFAQLHIPNGDTWFLKFDVDPKKEWLLCGVSTGEIHAWHLSPDRLPSTEPDSTIDCSYVVQARTIRQVAFEPHGRLIACVSDDATLTILERTDWKPFDSPVRDQSISSSGSAAE
ncbi:hypothetical protein PMAYCL1PPCAC_18822 [Pristionchus mayeri]|uniref:WD40 domain-containing protein n=1 Tax=Pristionchus mayeri TaxID=1317129 RepID=A0AAN5I1N6_9BILA|nr:hypothetical protein PMAYCL1PPCAC_18822 [Pristionchus mayeri]